MLKVAPNGKDIHKRVREIPAIVDLSARFRIMDQFGDYAQVICLGSPPIEVFGPPPCPPTWPALPTTVWRSSCASTLLGFPAFIASLPMNDPDGTVEGSATRSARSGRRGRASVHQRSSADR
jgi:hypothetical protein